jgi:hypothetical protein
MLRMVPLPRNAGEDRGAERIDKPGGGRLNCCSARMN